MGPGCCNPVLSVAHMLKRSSLFLLCSSWTNKLITAKNHASVQINIGHLDEQGVYTGSFSTFALHGEIRSKVRWDERALGRGSIAFAGELLWVDGLMAADGGRLASV